MRLLQRSVRHFAGIAGLGAITLVLAGCTDPGHPALPPPPPPDPAQMAMIPLQVGDTLEVVLSGTPMPIQPLTFVLSGSGSISLPNLDPNIQAVGRTPHELEQFIHDLYVPKVFTHISVTATPGLRFYYVSGAINQTGTGKQPYTGKVTVLGAIGAAGGFNDFAARKRVQLTRQDGTIFFEDCDKALKNPKLDLEVLPGDRIFVDKQTAGEALGLRNIFKH
jgi:protein involved in polysaccharide export with SLBB domain